MTLRLNRWRWWVRVGLVAVACGGSGDVLSLPAVPPRPDTVVCCPGQVGDREVADAPAAPAITSIVIRAMNPLPPQTGSGYSVGIVTNGSVVQRRLYLHGHHFLSALRAAGAFAIRPRPGVDANGWGPTLYLHAALPDAVLTNAVVTAYATASGVVVRATGPVWRAVTAARVGSWNAELLFSYNPVRKRVVGAGTFRVQLSRRLSAQTGDLTLYRLASNYLEDVACLDGTRRDTGDLLKAMVSGSGFSAFNWTPSTASPGHFPTDESPDLTVNAVGALNQVDTLAQDGVCPMQAAWKPSLQVTLTSVGPMVRGMRFGGLYAVAEATNFAADNVGLTPIVYHASTQTNFQFDVRIRSDALAGDGKGFRAVVSATYQAGAGVLDVFCKDRLAAPFRMVGSIRESAPGVYTGTVRVPFLGSEVNPNPADWIFHATLHCK